MDKGKGIKKFNNVNAKMYLDLKDIIREHALQFLPAKSVSRCNGVCRDWKLQISTPFFAHNQTTTFRGFSGFFYQNMGDSPSFIPLDPKAHGVPDPSLKFFPEAVDLLSSSHGLICCQGRGKDKAYYICNPVTKQWKKLPQPNSDHGQDPAVVLVYEPSLLNFVADYKLICAFPSSDLDNALEFEIYSSTNNSWRVFREICFVNWRIKPRSGVYANGSVYWQANDFYHIVAFDLIKERSLLHSTSGSLAEMNRKLCSFSALHQQLNISVLSNIHSNTTGDYKVGKSTGKLWKGVHTIPLKSSENSGSYGRNITGLFADNGMVVYRSGGTVVSHNLRTKEDTILFNRANDSMRLIPYCNNFAYF